MIRKIYQVDREIGGFLAHEPPDPTKETLGIKPQKDAQSEAARRGFGGEEEMDKRYLPGTSDNPRTKKREYFNIENVPAETDEYADIELAQKPPKGQVLTWRDPDFYRSTVVGQTEPKRGRIRKSTTVGSVEKEGIQRNYSLEKGGGYSKRERGTSSLGQPADKGKKYRKSWGKPSATRRRNGK